MMAKSILTSADMDYNSKVLPDGFEWVGAVAGPDGYTGHAYVANVAKDDKGYLWCFAECGRFRIATRSFEERKISDKFLPALPLSLSPDD